MKKLTLTLLTCLFILSPNVVLGGEVTMDDLEYREGLFYKKFTEVPFSGTVTGRQQGSLKNGKKEGPWVSNYKNGQVFPVLDREGKLSPRRPRDITKSFKRHISKLDITQITFHELRHTHATRLLQDGIHIKVVSERLGHSGVTITMEIYQTVLPAMQDEVADYLDEGFIIPIAEQDMN